MDRIKKNISFIGYFSMIQIHKKDSIIDIIIKITHSKDKEIILEFPFGHPVLHNYTSLKVLKEKAENKRLVIITNDVSAQKIGKKLGIAYSRLHHRDVVAYNYSFGGYAQVLLKNYYKEVISLFGKNEDVFYSPEHKSKYLKQKSRIGLFLIILLFSFFFLIFIFYFAVNKTYISITPEITAKIKAKNFTFQESVGDSALDSNIIPLKKIVKLVSIDDIFGTSGLDISQVTPATGRVILQNKTSEVLDLRSNSRLQAENGSVYIIAKPIKIPAASYSASGSIVAGQLVVSVTSKSRTIDGKVAGLLPNIGSGSYLFFPGLASQKLTIFALSENDFVGATNNSEKIITKDDIENAKKIIEEKLQKKALSILKQEIKDSNLANNVEYKILSAGNSVVYSRATISGDNLLKIGEKRDNFPLSGSIKVTSYVYNAQLVLSKLKKSINDGVLSDIEKILTINEESLRTSHRLYKNTAFPFTVKATTQVEVFYIHNFLSKENNFIKKLTSFIQAMDKAEAEKLLLNSPRISNVDIEIQPFFMNTISKIPDNIIFTVEEK